MTMHTVPADLVLPVLVNESFSIVSEIGEPIYGQRLPNARPVDVNCYQAIGVRGPDDCRAASHYIHDELRRLARIARLERG